MPAKFLSVDGDGYITIYHDGDHDNDENYENKHFWALTIFKAPHEALYLNFRI